MRRPRNIKIIATLGPAAHTEAQIEALFESGADVFRINMSHAQPGDLPKRVAAIRAVEAKVGRPIGILADLQGPKLRIGQFANGAVELEEGMAFRLMLEEKPGDTHHVTLPHPEVLQVLEPGHCLLLSFSTSSC